MTLYIHPENQQLLWSIMNKIPMITDFFTPYPPTHKEQWFKSVIQLFYEKYKNKRLQLTDLHQLNQETVAYIVQTIREKSQPQRPIQPQPIMEPDKKQEYYDQQFNARQTEYNSMLNKPTPPEVNFREKEEDTAISNMDELIRQHMAQREHELKQYSPPPPTITQPPVNIKSEIIETPRNREVIEESKPKKSVSWNTGDVIASYEERLHMQSEEITYLKSVVSSLSSTIETICKEMIHIKQYVDVSSTEQFILSQHQ